MRLGKIFCNRLFSFEFVRVPEKDIVKYGVGPAQFSFIVRDVNEIIF